MPGHDVLLVDQVRRQVEAAAEPPDVTGIEEPHVQVARRRVGIARVHDDGDAHRAVAATGQLRIARGCRGRQLAAADIRQGNARPFEHRALFLHGRDAPATHRRGIALALPDVALERPAHRCAAERGTQVVLQLQQVGMDGFAACVTHGDFAAVAVASAFASPAT